MKIETMVTLPGREDGTGDTVNKLDIATIYKDIHEKGGLDGKKVLIVGAGGNTEFWKSIGCTTLDINPNVSPDLVADANHLESIGNDSKYDIVYCEYLKMNPSGENGVNISNLMQGAGEILNEGGIIMLATATVDYDGEFDGSEDYGLRTLPVVSEIVASVKGFSAHRYLIEEGMATVTDPRQFGDETIASGIYYESRVWFVAMK